MHLFYPQQTIQATASSELNMMSVAADVNGNVACKMAEGRGRRGKHARMLLLNIDGYVSFRVVGIFLGILLLTPVLVLSMLHMGIVRSVFRLWKTNTQTWFVHTSLSSWLIGWSYKESRYGWIPTGAISSSLLTMKIRVSKTPSKTIAMPPPPRKPLFVKQNRRILPKHKARPP